MTNANMRLSAILVIAFLLTLFSACTKPPVKPIAPSEFTKEQRLELGELIRSAIALDQDHFEILPKAPPYDTSVYYLLQGLYNQATNAMRVDNHSPSANRWDFDREWPVTVLVSDERNAFVLPGGFLYITTGLLQTMTEEYEAYYILSFEANLMNEGLLLNRLISEINTTALVDIINGNPSPGGQQGQSMAQILSTLTFDSDEVWENDLITAASICHTSKWDRKGLLPLLTNIDNNFEWFTYRPSYSGRDQFIATMEVESDADCGSLHTNYQSGGYKRYVLDRL